MQEPPHEKNLTISVTKVNEERLNAVTATSMATSLSGKVAGLRISNASGTPGNAANVLLRADNNLNNVGSGPLILIDGVIFQGSLSDLNADDVENMEIIKGAAASALYGSRAGNGVIAITTKRGSRAELNKVNVNVRNEYGIQQLPKLLDLATHHPYKLASDYQSYAGKYTKYDGVTYPSDYIGAGYNPSIKGNRAIDADHYLDNPFGVNTNQQEEFFRTGNNMTNYVSLGSRSNRSSVFVSFENNKQSGIVNNTDGFSRQNFRINYDLNVNKWLTLSSSNLFINTATNYPGSAGSVFFNIVLAEPDANLYQSNPDGQPYFLKINQFNGETINPLYNLYKVQRDNKSRSWIGNYKANLKLQNGQT
ncbi:MAG: TonB-dependent receptor plug domain-containing protein [Cytophagaceae bacterium]|nr:TonB-dependent receptor plug domain-containing protein [Cytophagaceae bacterium]